MRIFTKTSPMFVNSEKRVDDKDRFVRCSPGKFHDVPDWVKNDLTFQLGVKAGDIEVIETKAAEKRAEFKAETKVAEKR
jgi:hypothetical protein